MKADWEAVEFLKGGDTSEKWDGNRGRLSFRSELVFDCKAGPFRLRKAL